MESKSYLKRTFTVSDPDARLRQGNDLTKFVTGAGGQPKTIPNNTKIAVKDVRTMPSGAKGVSIFVQAFSSDGATELGWTSAGNLAGKFLSETIGEISPPPGANRFGANAAWADGNFLGQITLVKVVGTNSEIECIAAATCDKFLALVAAARGDGRSIELNSGFRSWPEQKHLHDGFTRGLPGFNPANRPGFSNHQNGIAFDLNVKPGEGNPDYEWLKGNATRFGFVRTVSREAWHWEFLPDKAARAKAQGKFSTF